ncbi:hypothetical protein ACW9HR_37355 [Nocardia gipuzkoensis]
MGAETPDDLTPAQRHQYLENYINKCLAEGRAPKTVEGWLRAVEYWKNIGVQGKALEEGLNALYKLRESGYLAHEHYKVPGGKSIFVDWYLPKHLAKDGIAVNIEAKTGETERDRFLAQLKGYHAKLRAGERVILYIPKEALAKQGPEARQAIAAMQKQFPDRFNVQAMSPKALARISAAGMQRLQREARAQLAKDATRAHPGKEPIISAAALALSYAKEANQLSLAELRAGHEIVQELAAQELQQDLANAQRNAEDIGQGFLHKETLAQHFHNQAQDKHQARMARIDPLTERLYDRLRGEVERDAQAIQRMIIEAQAKGQQVSKQWLGKAYVTLGNTLDAVNREEDTWRSEQAKGLHAEGKAAFLGQVKDYRDTRDQPLHARIEAIGQAAGREEREKAAREAAQAAAEKARDERESREEANKQALRELGVPEQVINIAGLGQTQWTQQQLEAIRRQQEAEREAGRAPQVRRGGRAAERGQDRGQTRDSR